MTVHGILNVNKPRGWSSFDVVALVRRLSRQRRVGHAGTLDPAAEGVLPICLGQATRMVEYLVDAPKTYRAQIRLGVTTDTYDAWGTITATADPSGVNEAMLRETLPAFVGEIDQVPPMYSALKHQGIPLYRYARAGETVQRQPRRVVIHRLELLGYAPPIATVEVECGRGAYIRTLAHDLGRALGCGAHLDSLLRTRLGTFSLAAAANPDALRQAFRSGTWQDLLLPIDSVLLDWPAAIIGEASERLTRLGRPLTLPSTAAARRMNLRRGMPCRAYSLGGFLVAILRYEGGHALWRPEKVFAAPEETPNSRRKGRGPFPSGLAPSGRSFEGA